MTDQMNVAPWPSFTPHPDDNTRCYVCGRTEGHHGTESNHCPPADLSQRIATPLDVLPMELDDGTRMTCTAIAGGAESVRGVPNFLMLEIAGEGENNRNTHRYVSEHALNKALMLSSELAPGDLDLASGLLKGRLEEDADLDERATAPYKRLLELVDWLRGRSRGRQPPLPRSILDRARAELERRVDRLFDGGFSDKEFEIEMHTLAFYVIAEHLREIGRSNTPSSKILAGLAQGAGHGFGGRMASVLAQQTPSAPRTSRRKPAKQSKAKSKRR